ncbi:AgmX/PglI C-terminal domain-containing protein [Myxococcota bacterium]|nr:AgmX/PglI C-terminal domain-containing protein [Myxococcota bacterium]
MTHHTQALLRILYSATLLLFASCTSPLPLESPPPQTQPYDEPAPKPHPYPQVEAQPLSIQASPSSPASGGVGPKLVPKPTPAAWLLEPMGSIEKALIQRVINVEKNAIRECYERGLKKLPTLHGKISLKWQILADGRVGEIMINESTLGNEEVEKCITDSIKSWVFSPPAGGWVEVNYPFVFKIN